MASALVLVGCTRQPAMFSAPRFAGNGPRIEREQVGIRCTGDKARVRCEADGDYRLEPTDRASRATISSRRATTRIDTTTVELEPGQTRLCTHATLAPPPFEGLRFWEPAPLVRHPALSRALGYRACVFDPGGCRFDIDYLSARPTERADGHTLEVRVGAPEGWDVDQRALPPGPASDTVTHSGAPSPEDARIATTLRTGGARFAPGGPFMGVGPRFYDGAIVGAARVGWEVFAPDWIAYGFSFDADASRRLATAFTTELTAPSLLGVFPSFGVGLGLPIELAPDLAAGARMQLSAHFPYLGVIATFDVYPGRPDPITRTLYLQVSL
jgi:hypothetical protein